jgi:hypothetical protein
MRELREIEAIRRVQDARDALRRRDAADGRRSSRGRRRRSPGASRCCPSTHPGWLSSPRATWPGWARRGAIGIEGRAGRDRGRIFRSLRFFEGRLLPYHRARSGAAIPSSSRAPDYTRHRGVRGQRDTGAWHCKSVAGRRADHLRVLRPIDKAVAWRSLAEVVEVSKWQFLF